MGCFYLFMSLIFFPMMFYIVKFLPPWLIPKCFILIDALVKKKKQTPVFIIFYSLLVYRNVTEFSALVLYPILLT